MSVTSIWVAGVKMIESSSVHVPPRPLAASHSVTTAPPVRAIFFSLPPAKNAIHWPSGLKNGVGRSFGAREHGGLQLIEPSDEKSRHVRLLRHERQRRSVGRENGRRASVRRQGRRGADVGQQPSRLWNARCAPRRPHEQRSDHRDGRHGRKSPRHNASHGRSRYGGRDHRGRQRCVRSARLDSRDLDARFADVAQPHLDVALQTSFK